MSSGTAQLAAAFDSDPFANTSFATCPTDTARGPRRVRSGKSTDGSSRGDGASKSRGDGASKSSRGEAKSSSRGEGASRSSRGDGASSSKTNDTAISKPRRTKSGKVTEEEGITAPRSMRSQRRASATGTSFASTESINTNESRRSSRSEEDYGYGNATPPVRATAGRARRGRRASLLGSTAPETNNSFNANLGSNGNAFESNNAAFENNFSPNFNDMKSGNNNNNPAVDYGYGDDAPDYGYGDSNDAGGFGAFQTDFNNTSTTNATTNARPRAARRSSIDVSKLASDVKSGGADFIKTSSGGNDHHHANGNNATTIMPMVLPDTSSSSSKPSRRGRRASLVGAVGGAMGDLVGGAVGVVTSQQKDRNMLHDSNEQKKKSGSGFFKDRDRKMTAPNRSVSGDDSKVLASYRGTTERRRVGTLKVSGEDRGAAASSGNKTSYSDRILNNSQR